MLKGIIEKTLKHINTIFYWRMKGVSIGENCEIYRSANFGSEPYLIAIGDHVRINSGVQFVTHDGGVWVCREYIKSGDSYKIDIFGPISVGNNVHIGNNVIIMPGVKIGNNSIIGCGSIVTRDIPDGSVAVGIPARVIESLDEYITKNKNKFLYTKHLSKNEKKLYLEKEFNKDKIKR